jgi:hypothetical protein
MCYVPRPHSMPPSFNDNLSFLTASGQKHSCGTDPFAVSLPYPINLALLTTLPDRLLGTFYAWPTTLDQLVVDARKTAVAWTKSKEAIGGKMRKTQQD